MLSLIFKFLGFLFRAAKIFVGKQLEKAKSAFLKMIFNKLYELKNSTMGFVLKMLIGLAKEVILGFDIFIVLILIIFMTMGLSALLSDISFQYVVDFNDFRDEVRYANVKNTKIMHENFYERVADTSFYQVFNTRDRNASKHGFLESTWKQFEDKVLFGFLNWDDRLYVTDANKNSVKYLKQASAINTEDDELLGGKFYRDFYNREELFKLSPSLLGEMNKVVFDNYGISPNESIKYPEAFTKPVHFVYDFMRVDYDTGEPYTYITQRYTWDDVLAGECKPYDASTPNEAKMEGKIKSKPSYIIYEYAVRERNDHQVYGKTGSQSKVAFRNVVEYVTIDNPDTGAREMVKLYYVIKPNSNGEYPPLDIDESEISMTDTTTYHFDGPYGSFEDAKYGRNKLQDNDFVRVNGVKSNNTIRLDIQRPIKHFQLAPLTDKNGQIVASSSVLINTNIVKEKVVKDSFRNDPAYVDKLEIFISNNQDKYDDMDDTGFKLLSNRIKAIWARIDGNPESSAVNYKESTMAQIFEDFDNELVEKGTYGIEWEWAYSVSYNDEHAYKVMQQENMPIDANRLNVPKDKKSWFEPVGYQKLNETKGEMELQLNLSSNLTEWQKDEERAKRALQDALSVVYGQFHFFRDDEIFVDNVEKSLQIAEVATAQYFADYLMYNITVTTDSNGSLVINSNGDATDKSNLENLLAQLRSNFEEIYNEYKSNYTDNKLKSGINEDNFLYTYSKSEGLKEKSLPKGTENTDYVWDKDNNRPAYRNHATGELSVLPLELKSVRDYGLGSILSYIEGRKVEFKSGIYYDDIYNADGIKEYFDNRYTNIDSDLAKKGYYPKQIFDEKDYFHSQYFLNYDLLKYFEKITEYIPKFPNNIELNNEDIKTDDDGGMEIDGTNLIIKKSGEVINTEYNKEDLLEDLEDGDIKKYVKDETNSLVKIFTPQLQETNLLVKWWNELWKNEEYKLLYPSAQFLNPLKYYLAWYDVDKVERSSGTFKDIVRVLTFQKGLIALDSEVGIYPNDKTGDIQNQSVMYKLLKESNSDQSDYKDKYDFKQCFETFESSDELKNEFMTKYKSQLANFEYTNPAMAEELFLIDEALTFAGKFVYTYEDIVSKLGPLLATDNKRVKDIVFADRYIYVDKWDVSIDYTEYRTNNMIVSTIDETIKDSHVKDAYNGGYSWELDDWTVVGEPTETIIPGKKGKKAEKEGEVDEPDEPDKTKYTYNVAYSEKKNSGKFLKENELKNLFGEHAYPRMKVYTDKDNLIKEFDNKWIELNKVQNVCAKEENIGYPIKDYDPNKSSEDMDVDLRNPKTIPYPNYTLADAERDFETFRKDSNGLKVGVDITKVWFKLNVEDLRNKGEAIPLYRNYEGYRREILPMEIFQYFEGEEFGSWTNRMRVDGRNLDELEHLRHEQDRYTKYLEDYLMFFETYVPLNVKADSDLEDRGSVGYGKLMPNEVKQPELTKDYSSYIFAETSKPYWLEIAKELNIKEGDAPVYFAQILQGILEEEALRLPDMVVKAYANDGVLNSFVNRSAISYFPKIRTVNPPSLTIDLEYQVTESKVSTKPFRMPYIGIANIEYINNISSSPAPVLSTKKFGATFVGGDFKRYQEVEGLRIKGQLIEPDAEISIYYDENGNLIDDRLDPEEAIHFAGVKLAKLIKSNSSIPEAIYCYFVGEPFAKALFYVTQNTQENVGSERYGENAHGIWTNPTEDDMKNAATRVFADFASKEIDFEFLSPEVVKNVMSYVTDFTARKQMIYTQVDSLSMDGIDIGTHSQDTVALYEKQITHNGYTYNVGEIVTEASEKYGVDRSIILSLIMQESSGVNIKGYNPDGILYPAWGITQIQYVNTGSRTTTGYLADGSAYNVTIKTTNDIATDERLQVDKAVDWSVAHFTGLLRKYNGNLLHALQAYNMGSEAVDFLIGALGNEFYIQLINDYPITYKTVLLPEALRREWTDQARINRWKIGAEASAYGDPRYIKNVLKYYNSTFSTNGGIGQYNISSIYGTSATSGWQKLTNSVDVLFGKNYENFKNSGVEPYVKHLTVEQVYNITANSASYRYETKMLGRLDYNIFDLFGNSFNGSKINGFSSRGVAIMELDELREYIYNIDDYRPPVDWDEGGYSLSKGFGMRYIHNQQDFHEGIDISNVAGKTIYPMAPGTVVRVYYDDGSATGYGNGVAIAHPMKDPSTVDENARDPDSKQYYLISIYGHMRTTPLVRAGDEVTADTKLGEIGSTGHSTGPHLHFEVRTSYSSATFFSKLLGFSKTYDASPEFISKYFTDYTAKGQLWKSINPFIFIYQEGKISAEDKQRLSVTSEVPY